MDKPLNLIIYYEIGTAVTAKAIQEQLSANVDASEIILHINSQGGSVYEGYAIYNLLKNTGKKITARIDGMCASIATLIALSAEEIELFPLSQWLIHPPFAGIEGTASDLAAASQELKRIEDTISELYATKTGKPVQEILDLMKEDRFLTPKEAIEWGFADRVLEPLKAVAYYDFPKSNNPTKPDTNMSTKTETSPLAKVKAAFAAFAAAFDEAETTPDEPQANSETLENDSKIYFEGELSENSLVFSDEAMTISAENGEYTLKDGRVVAVEGGAVKSITPAAPENNAELEAAQNRVKELEGELETLKATASAKDTTIQNLKKLVPGGTGGKAATPPQNHAAENEPAANSKTEHTQAFSNAAEKLKAKYNRK